MINLNRLFVAALVHLAFVTAPAAALDLPPHPKGPIFDQAGLLPAAEEAALDQRLREFDKQTGDAVIIATVDSLQGNSIEDFATKLYADWGIGGAERDTGVLLLVAPNERKVRIEVGYGLTPYITDILSGRIIRDDITPHFKAGDMSGGIQAGVNAILEQLSKSPADAKAVAEAAAAAEKDRVNSSAAVPVGTIFWVLIIVFFFILPAFGRAAGGRRYRRGGMGGTVGNVLLWSALNAAAHSGRGGHSSGGFGGFSGGGNGGF